MYMMVDIWALDSHIILICSDNAMLVFMSSLVFTTVVYVFIKI